MRTAESLGVPIRAVVFGNSHGVLSRSPQGRDGMFYIPYYSTTGSALVGYHPAGDELIEAKLGSSGGYGCCVAADGALYIGGVHPGDLYRYDPATRAVRGLGGSQFGVEYIWATAASRDGKVYAACFPTCSVLEYDVNSAVLRDLGKMTDTEQYCRSICVDHRGKVWVGVGTHAQLIVLDPATGGRHDVLPEQYHASSSCYDLQATGKYVVASVLLDGVVLVYDADTEQVVRVIPRPEDAGWWMNAHGAPPGEAYLYSTPDGDLYHYHIARDRLTLAAPGLGQCEQIVERRYVHGINDQDYFLYDLHQRRYLARRRLTQAGDGMAIQTLTGGPDGRIYGSTYINQHAFRYDPATREMTDLGKVVRVGGQVDSIHAGRDGRIYLGAYVLATLAVYDPAAPWRPGRDPDSNPRELGSVGHGQYRTRAIVLGPDDRIWVGTIPSYNSAPTGALSCWDPATGEHKSWLDLVPGGAVHRIAADDTYLYCAGGGRFFVWDPFGEAKVHEEEREVFSLVVTGDASVLANGGAEMLVFDPRAMAVAHTFPSPIGRMDYMVLAPNGHAYGINGSGVCEIEPGTWAARQIADQGGDLLATDGDGNLYFARGSVLYRLR